MGKFPNWTDNQFVAGSIVFLMGLIVSALIGAVVWYAPLIFAAIFAVIMGFILARAWIQRILVLAVSKLPTMFRAIGRFALYIAIPAAVVASSASLIILAARLLQAVSPSNLTLEDFTRFLIPVFFTLVVVFMKYGFKLDLVQLGNELSSVSVYTCILLLLLELTSFRSARISVATINASLVVFLTNIIVFAVTSRMSTTIKPASQRNARDMVAFMIGTMIGLMTLNGTTLFFFRGISLEEANS